MANVYAPLYNSLQARGRMSPLGAPGAIRPEKKKKGLGDKMAGALGAMIDQAMQGNDEKRISQLVLRNEDLKEQVLDWRGSDLWNEENYKWEAFGEPHSGHAMDNEYKSNIEEIKNIQLKSQMDEPGTLESMMNSFIKT